MKGYKVNTVCVEVKQDGFVDLNDYQYVIGVSVEITNDSSAASLLFGLNVGPHIKVNQGEGARGFGGFHVCNAPAFYEGKVNIKFAGGLGQAYVMITELTGKTKEIPGT
jgi:hypothetical protein